MFKKFNDIYRRWPLWLQLSLSVSLILILVNLLTVPLTYHFISSFQLNQVDKQSRSSLALLAASSIDAVITEDVPLLTTIAAQSLEQAPDMVSLTISNEQGSILVERFRKNTPAGNIHQYDYVIEYENEQFGNISIQWDVQPAYQTIHRHVTRVQIFISAMLIFLAMLILMLIHWLAIRPIRRITNYITSLSEDKLPSPLKLDTSTSRELELLASSAGDLFVAMRQRDQREKELIQTREELLVAHDKALSASRAKSGFLASMSHEIRTPMNAVLGVLGLLKDTSLNDDQLQLVQTGRASGELLLTIINDVLDFSRMEADKLELEHNEFDLYHQLTQSIELLKHQADRKKLALILIIEPNLPHYAKGDPDRIRQILINLINNAIKFTPGGSITVRATTNEIDNGNFTLHCTVQDTGIGIAKELQTSLFKEFTMADQTHSRKHEGTGLGLAICKRLTTLMHGNISVYSEPEQGTTVTFTVQLEAIDKLESASEITDEPKYMPDKNTRILLAEDNPANQMVIKNILEYAGLQVDIVANGREAVDAIRNLPYDIVLMDISMPEMDGMTATREIRKLPSPASATPIVAITAHALAGDREHFLKAGMDDYLTKPINRAATLNCIGRLTGAPLAAQKKQAEAADIQVDTSTADIDEDYVDESVLQQLSQDTAAEVVPEFLTLYISDARKRVKIIYQAIKNNDFKTLEFESHTLGSSAAAHGNAKLHTLARKIENFCQQEKHEQAISNATKLLPIADKSFQLLAKRANQGF